MIEGVKKIQIVRHADDRGYVEEILRRDDPHFEEFGQIYLTTQLFNQAVRPAM